MSGAPFPPVSELVPHSGPMCLLERVVEHGSKRTVCTVDPARSGILADPDGSVPVWVALEYMAQCIAVHGGLAARAEGRPLLPGLFIGSRRVRFDADRLAPGRELLVVADHHRGERHLVAFDCEVRETMGGAPLVQGRMNVYIVDRWEDLEVAEIDGA